VSINAQATTSVNLITTMAFSNALDVGMASFRVVPTGIGQS